MVSYSANQTTVNNCNQVNDQAVFEADKRAVYKLVIYLFRVRRKVGGRIFNRVAVVCIGILCFRCSR